VRRDLAEVHLDAGRVGGVGVRRRRPVRPPLDVVRREPLDAARGEVLAARVEPFDRRRVHGKPADERPHSVDMFAIAMRESLTGRPHLHRENSTAALRTSSLLYRPHSVDDHVLAGHAGPEGAFEDDLHGARNRPPERSGRPDRRRIGADDGRAHRASAPYILEWESEATTKEPGTTYPCSHMIW